MGELQDTVEGCSLKRNFNQYLVDCYGGALVKLILVIKERRQYVGIIVFVLHEKEMIL